MGQFALGVILYGESAQRYCGSLSLVIVCIWIGCYADQPNCISVSRRPNRVSEPCVPSRQTG